MSENKFNNINTTKSLKDEIFFYAEPISPEKLKQPLKDKKIYLKIVFYDKDKKEIYVDEPNNVKVRDVIKEDVEFFAKKNFEYNQDIIISHKFNIKDFLISKGFKEKKDSLNQEVKLLKDVKYISCWIDANNDNEVSIEYNEEVVVEVCNCCITKEMLSAMGCVNVPNETELLEALNKYCEQYEINTCLRIAHFLSQAAHESECFSSYSEKTNYAESIAIKCSSYASYRETPIGKALELNPRKNKKGEIVDYDCKQPEYFNCKYANNQGNGNFESGDGHKFRGSGLIQITFRDTYKNFTTRYNQRNPDDIKDFEANQELVRTEIKYAVASACDYWRNKPGGGKSNLNLHADAGTSDEVVLKISAVVNGYHNKNLSEYNELSPSDKEKYKKAEDNLYLKKPNGYDDRLDKFNKLKKHMGL